MICEITIVVDGRLRGRRARAPEQNQSEPWPRGDEISRFRSPFRVEMRETATTVSVPRAGGDGSVIARRTGRVHRPRSATFRRHSPSACRISAWDDHRSHIRSLDGVERIVPSVSVRTTSGQFWPMRRASTASDGRTSSQPTSIAASRGVSRSRSAAARGPRCRGGRPWARRPVGASACVTWRSASAEEQHRERADLEPRTSAKTSDTRRSVARRRPQHFEAPPPR